MTLDRQSPPRRIATANLSLGRFVFWRSNGIFFYVSEGDSGFVYRMNADGTDLQKALAQSTSQIQGISPQGEWIVVWDGVTRAYPASGGAPVRIFGSDIRLYWSADARFVSMMVSTGQAAPSMKSSVGRTYVVPLSPGKPLPPVPDGGFRSADQIASLPGVRVIESADTSPGPTPDAYAFSREMTQRNLYRIPLP